MKEQKNKNFILEALSIVFKDPIYLFLATTSGLFLLAIYYFLFRKTTTFDVFLSSNTLFYNFLSILMTILISIFFAIAIAFLVWQWLEKSSENKIASTSNTFLGSILGALSVGCPVCGSFLLSALGIAGGLFAFPFQGLEIKAISLFLLGFSIFTSSKSIYFKSYGICEPTEKIFSFEKDKLVLNINKNTIKPLLPIFLGFLLLFFIFLLPSLANKINLKVTFQKRAVQGIQKVEVIETPKVALENNEIILQINPPQGYEIKATYGKIGPKLLEVGAIDLEKMKKVYEQSGQPLTKEQLKILTEGSNERIKITPENAYFLLNFLWALGLANKNKILDEGPMMRYGKEELGNFASTGGWTLGKKPATELYSKFEIVKLTPEQQKILEEFAFNSYRPCCSNPTGFPDCNHGMAALALGEIMAASGATLDEIFEAFKYFNAFWFPQTYFDVAKYFKAKEGKDWKDVPGRIVASLDYSSPEGWQRVRSWLKTAGLLEQPPTGGGDCGV